MAPGTKATQQDSCRERRENSGHIGGTTVNEFEGICFQHKSQEILVRFCFEHNWFSVEAFIKDNFIRGKITKATVCKDQTVVHVANVSDEEVVVCENFLEN